MKNVVYVLAVMLERAKILVERDAREQADHTIIRVYEHRKTGESFIVLDPRLRLENLAGGELPREDCSARSGIDVCAVPRESEARLDSRRRMYRRDPVDCY